MAGFIKIYRQIEENQRLWQDNGLFAFWVKILLLSGRNGEYIANLSDIAKRIGVSRPNMYKNLKILKEMGCLNFANEKKNAKISIPNYEKFQKGSVKNIYTQKKESVKNINTECKNNLQIDQNECKNNLHECKNNLHICKNFLHPINKVLQEGYKNNIRIKEINKETKIENSNLLFADFEKTKKFKKPTLQEIADYCKARNNKVDPGAFYDFYESKGWKVGSSPMKNWQAAVRTWERTENKQYSNKLAQRGSYLPSPANKYDVK